jgi:ribonuclease G
MSQEVYINVGAAETRVAVVRDGKLEALSCARTLGSDKANGSSLIGDIVVGRVIRAVPAVQAAFVEIGHERAGFLGAREARCLAGDPLSEATIDELVREGDKVLVQIIKDPMGEKGARLTASVTLPGRLGVLTPCQAGIALSRRIEDEAERARLQSIGEELTAEGVLPSGIGCIFRTAAIGASKDELSDDMQRLVGEWEAVTAGCRDGKVPSTLRRDLVPVERALRDIVQDDTSRILIDDAQAADRARRFCRETMPHVEERIEFFAGPGSLFDDLEAEIGGLMHPRVPLSCGGWITIEGTEALTAVDVNSGSFTQANAVEDTGLTVNLEAAHEIGRHLRLRGIGGLIVVDFIHMKEPGHIECVLDALSASLAMDRAPFTVGLASPLGLIEITRKRVREPLETLCSEDCPICAGLGRVRRPDVVAMDILRRVEESARAAPGKAVQVRAAPEVVRWLEEQGETLNAALARKGVARLQFESDESFSRECYEVGTSA